MGGRFSCEERSGDDRIEGYLSSFSCSIGLVVVRRDFCCFHDDRDVSDLRLRIASFGLYLIAQKRADLIAARPQHLTQYYSDGQERGIYNASAINKDPHRSRSPSLQ